MDIIGVIPARYKSSRFPGKALADLCGKPVIWWVYKNTEKTYDFKKIYIATDDERIKEACEKYDMNVIMTSDKHKTGTDRVSEVARKIDADLYVNIQGDEPLINPETIKKVIKPFRTEKTDFEVTCGMIEIKDFTDLIDNTVCKVAVNSKNEALIISRLPIPYPKNREGLRYFKQISVFCFTPKALQKFNTLKRGPFEKAEDIELNRFIENHITVKMIEVDEDTVAVDTPSDLEIVKKIIEKGEYIL